MTGPREWRHAATCAFRRGNGSLRGLPCNCGLIGWEQDPRTDDGHAHEWEVVMLGPPGHHRVEEVVRCSVCHCPRCGYVYDPNPCLLRRHHQPRWPEHEYANGGKEKVGT